MAINFEIETQQELNWCWAAVAAAVGRYYYPDKGLQQCQVAGKVTGIANCCPHNEACDQFGALDDALTAANAEMGTNLSNRAQLGKILKFAAVQAEIDGGRPVGVRIQWYGEDAGHFVIISGYAIEASGEKWLDISDPYYEDSTVPYDQFVSAYLEAGKWSDTYLIGQP
jgi:Papain-like cysteine protease AvrRpt2